MIPEIDRRLIVLVIAPLVPNSALPLVDGNRANYSSFFRDLDLISTSPSIQTSSWRVICCNKNFDNWCKLHQ